MRAAVLMLSLLLCAPVQAGPWVPGRWHFSLQLRQAALFADQRYDAGGARRPILAVPDQGGAPQRASYRQALTSLSGELGLAQRLSVVLDLLALDAVVQPISGRADRTVVGVSDLRLGGKLLLFDDELTAAIEVALTIPTGSAARPLPLGPGDLRTDFVLHVGKTFRRPDLYLLAEVGFRLRSAAEVANPMVPGTTAQVSYAHEIRYGAQAGTTWRKGRPGLRWLGAALRIEGSYALASAVEDGLGILNPIAGSYCKLGPEVTWSPLLGLLFGVGGGYFVAGREMPAMGEAWLSVTYLR